MNREIKFRAWDKTNSQWVWAYIKSDEGNLLDHNLQGFDEDITLMQFTGLKDRNGREIYEGDVVWRYSVGQRVVKWTSAPFKEGWNITKGLYRMDWEVIGNVYDHPHLLESGIIRNKD